MYSYNGITWTYAQSPSGISTVNSIAWDGSNWNIAGTAGSLQRLALSSDAINWSPITSGITSAKINAIGYSSNTTFPEYSLDIATGNARKPIGTNWVTASDARVKKHIETVDLVSCAKLISEIPLRTYSFTNEFQEKTGIKPLTYYGFIAQEVKEVLPNSVSYTKEHGLDDFHSLDTDQIFKLEFGATQYLLSAVQKLEAQISTLESCHKTVL
jgi:hypothetical protein